MREAWVWGEDGPAAAALMAGLAELGYASPRAAASIGPHDAVAALADRAEPDIACLVAGGATLAHAIAVADAVRGCDALAGLPLVLVLDDAALAARPTPRSVDEIVVAGGPVDELALRIARAWQRAGAAVEGESLVLDGLRLDPVRHTTTIDGRLVELTPMEHRLLRFLLLHPGRVFTREALLDRVWGHAHYGAARTVDVQVRRLRARLGSEYGARIETVRAVGYRLAC